MVCKTFLFVNSFSTSKMCEMKTLKLLSSQMIINNGIQYSSFNLPSCLYNDLMRLNSIKMLKEEEYHLKHRIRRLETLLPEVIREYNSCYTIWEGTSLDYVDFVNDALAQLVKCERVKVKIERKFFESEMILQTIRSEDKVLLKPLDVKYKSFKFV